MSYFQRPKLVRNALQSILRANEFHQDWVLAFGDDGSDIPGAPIVEEIMKDHMGQVTLVHTGMTFEDKIRDGLVLGHHCNRVIRESDADIGVMFCDDDELHPMYLKNLSDYFDSHPEILYSYSKIHLFNPLKQKSTNVDNLDSKYNQWDGPINPVNRVDASQVAWRLECCRNHGAWTGLR